jgi:hypothetical protein
MKNFVTCAPSEIGIIKLRRMRCAGYVAQMAAKRNTYIFVGEPKRKRPLRQGNEIKMDLEEIGREVET